MKDPIQDYATVGLVHFMMWKSCIRGAGDFSPALDFLENRYFQGMELSWVQDDTTRRHIASHARKHKKHLSFGAQPVLLTQQLDINHLDEAERRAAVTAVCDVVPQAAELGVRGFALLSGKVVPTEQKSKAMEQLIRSLVEIGRHVKEHADIPLVLETFDQLPYGKNCLIGSHKDAALVAKEVRQTLKDFGLLIDLSHLPLQGESVAQAWDVAGEYVVHAHIGNCIMNQPDHPMNGDEHPPLCDPAGENCREELAEFLRVLMREKFLNTQKKPFLSFEVTPYGDWNPDTLIPQCQQVLDDAWAIV